LLGETRKPLSCSSGKRTSFNAEGGSEDRDDVDAYSELTKLAGQIVRERQTKAHNNLEVDDPFLALLDR